MIQWKLGCRSRKQKRKNQPIAKSGIEHCHWFILPLLLATPTKQFSLDRKQRRHKQNQCSASDSVGLIFTRSYHSTLLITTPTTTPSLVKTSLEKACATVFNMYHVTKNTGLDEIKDEYSISHASYWAYFVILVACMFGRLSGRRKVCMYTDVTDHLFYILLATT